MPGIEFGCLPSIIGSMPHSDPSAACAQVIHYLKDIPAWPQLPKRTFLEDMRVQFSHGFPGVVLGEDSIYIDRSQDLDEPLEQLSTDYLENNIDEIGENGYEVLRGKRLKTLKELIKEMDVSDIDVGDKVPMLGIFNFRALLNIGMLLTESEKAPLN